MTVEQFATFLNAAILFRQVSYAKEQIERGLVPCPECEQHGSRRHCPVCHGRLFVAKGS